MGEIIRSDDLTHNSRKAWQTIRKISNEHTTPNPPCLITAHQLLVNGKASMPNKSKRPVLRQSREGIGSVVHILSEEEYKKGITALKNGKAAGIDDVLVEQIT